MSEALTTATLVLNSAWTFIEGNPILFGACALGLVGAGITLVKGLFA